MSDFAKMCNLDSTHCAALNLTLEECARWLDLCDKLKAAGIDTTEQANRFAAQSHTANELKATFFPHAH